ncbi:ferredoxin [Amycolatopsis japonica]
MEIHVDKERCVGASECLFAAPDVFDLRGSEGCAVVLPASPTEAMRPEVMTAARRCPVAAITVGD